MDDIQGAVEVLVELEIEERRQNRAPRIYRQRIAALEMQERAFLARFRLTKAVVRTLIEDLRPALPVQRRRSNLSIEVPNGKFTLENQVNNFNS